MPGGHGGGKGKPLAQRTPGELWTDVAILAAGANFFVAVPFVGQPRPGLVKYLALPLVEVIFGVVALAVAPVIAELARRGDRVPAWAGRRPLRSPAASSRRGQRLAVPRTRRAA